VEIKYEFTIIPSPSQKEKIGKEGGKKKLDTAMFTLVLNRGFKIRFNL
jgi:hypothetical protein